MAERSECAAGDKDRVRRRRKPTFGGSIFGSGGQIRPIQSIGKESGYVFGFGEGVL